MASAPHLLGIGEAAERAGVSERALRYYEQLGLITPCGHTPGGMRRYSEDNLDRVARIRELQTLLGFNLEEVAGVLRSEDRLAELKRAYHAEGPAGRPEVVREALALQEDLRATVDAKLAALSRFRDGVDATIARWRAVRD